MLLFNKIIVIFAILFIASCGFTPVYQQQDANSADILASVSVVSSRDLDGQSFSTKLEDLLNPNAKQIDKKYRIDTKLTKSKTPFAIQQDRTITRYKISVLVKYTIVELTTNKVVDQGTLKREGGFDVVESDYGSYISEEDTTKRIIKELAEDANIRIISIIVGN